MIKPTIGRVVLFHNNTSDQPLPGLICYVHSDRQINVGGHSKEGHPIAAINVQLLQDNDKAPENGAHYAEWMPYQKDAAAKADAVKDPPKEPAK